MCEFLKTKIIATIGPASSSEEVIKELISFGARVFRINSSHGTIDSHLDNIKKIRKVSAKLNQFVAIMLDLQGPKIRIGNLKAPVELVKNQKIFLKPGMDVEDEGVLPVDYAGILQDVKVGDHLLLDDGKLELTVTDVFKDKISVEVKRGGFLTSRKGLNIPESASKSVSAITERDVEFIKFGVENDIDYLALSFVRDENDILLAKKHLQELNFEIPIIAKIEKPQAVENLHSIIHAADGIMVARGDLGIEISPENVPMVQKNIINQANIHRKPVITATQMLESMINQPIPTRAEASDVANAIIDGTDAVMLSGETAVGNYPAETVSMMKKIARNVEQNELVKLNHIPKVTDDIEEIEAQAIVSATIEMISDIKVAAVIAITKTGYTARLLSKLKPSVPVIAISDDEKICRELALLWGILPYKMEDSQVFSEELLKKIDKSLIEHTFLDSGDKVVITGSLAGTPKKKTNFLRLYQLGQS